VQDTDEHNADRLAKVEQVLHLRVAEHLLWIAQVCLHGEDAGTGHQRGGVGGDHRIDVHIDDARLRRHAVSDLVGVSHAGQPRAKVEELADPLADHVVDHPLEQVTAFYGRVGRCRYPYVYRHRLDSLGGLPVDCEIVLAAQVIVPDTSRVGVISADRVIGL
jgi:hypothetical protein